jgi:hypothetical protein
MTAMTHGAQAAHGHMRDYEGHIQAVAPAEV